MMKKSIILSVLLFITTLTAWAQPVKEFSKNPAVFLEELAKMFENTQSKEQKDAGSALIVEFSGMWNANTFDDEVKDSVFALCNLMLKRKMKTYPNFFEYLTAVINFNNSRMSDESFKTWQAALRNLALMSNSIRFMSLIDGTNMLIRDKAISKSNIMTWKCSNEKYEFGFDSLPYFEFPKTDLSCLKKNDSTTIYNTGGRYYPTVNLWRGNEGMVYWDRAGLPIDEVYAEIHKPYALSLTKSEIEIDTVTFYNKKLFNIPLYGTLKDKVIADLNEERISYPRFNSFGIRVEINDIFKDIDYEGGFAMYGDKLMGQGDDQADAYIYMKKDNKLFVKLGAKNFIIRPEMVTSDRASVSIYLDKDSIYHPGIKMKYNNENRELSLIRENTAISKSPYYNSFHKIDMYFEALYWKLDEPKIDFTYLKGSGSESSALFESDNYYSEFRWEKLKGLEDVHPLVQLKQISDELGSKVFSDKDVQKKMRVSMTQIQNLLLTFSEKGFIIYDIDDGIVVLKDRLFHYINAKSGKTDYDVIQFNSVIAAMSNATLSLLNNDLKIRGVPMIFLSDSQNVYILPTDQEIILKKGRDFVFDGFVHAGLFNFYGKTFTFEYDMFRIKMPMVDSMTYKVQDRSQPLDMYGHHPLVQVRTPVEGMDAELLIDHPNNKSGLKSFPSFPSLTSKKDAYVYYDKSYIYNRVYSRDKFYFRVQPFKFDTLDSYDSDRKYFKGYLVSGGIFPDIYEPLRVQPDFSLGFVYKTQPEGLPAYGGKGKYDSIVDLSFKGFLGKGTLKYLTSVTKSHDIIFFPDSLYATAYQFVVKEKTTAVEFPPVYVENVDVKWYPYLDNMLIRQLDKPFDLFASRAVLNGGLSLRTSGLQAFGTITFDRVEMTSNLYKLKHHSYTADTAVVIFRTQALDDVVIQTDNFNVNVDFNKQLGKFKPNDEDARIIFPFNSYACTKYSFDWFMDKDKLKFSSNIKAEYPDLKKRAKVDLIDLDFTSSKFISLHPAQDSIYFYAPDAYYDLNINTIDAIDVPVILVADAAIFPDSGKVSILKKAEMLTLYDAEIITNTTSKAHKLYDVRTDILSRQNYIGSGYYDYRDETDKKQKIYMSNIKVDTSGQTTASGYIDEESSFTLSPYFGFTGTANLFADKDFLNFDGGVNIKHNCDTLQRHWLRFTSEINPNNIAIPVSEKPLEYIKGQTGKELGTGLFMGNDSVIAYPAFLGFKRKHSDSEVVSAHGMLTYNKNNQTYTIAPEVDSSSRYLEAGNVVSLDRNNCIINGSGKINLDAKMGQVKLNSYGRVTNNMNDLTTVFNLAMQIDFFLNDDAYAVFASAVDAEGGAEGVDTDDEKFYDALRFLVGPQKTDEIISQLNLSGRLKNIPQELKCKLFIADVTLKWNPKTESFLSEGPIGIAMMENTQLYKYIEGHIEIARKQSGNIMNLYFEVGNDWYFFNYASNKMQSISSRKEYNDLIKKAVTDGKNQAKAEEGQPPYVFMISTESRKKAFLKKIEGEDEGTEE